MLTPEQIKSISSTKGIDIRKDEYGLIVGRLKVGEKNYNFRIAYGIARGEGYAYLRMRRDSSEILKIFEQKIGKAQIRGECRDLVGKTAFYAWHEDGKMRDDLFQAMSFAVARGKFFGWQSVKKLAA